MEEEEAELKDIFIFINNVDRFISGTIAKYLSTQVPGITFSEEDEEEIGGAEERISEPAGPPLPKSNCYIIGGTLSSAKAKKPHFVREIIDYDKKWEFFEHLMKYNVIVYDICEDPKQIHEALWIAETMEKNFAKFNHQKMLIVISNLMTWCQTKSNDSEDTECSESEYRRRKPHPDYKEIHEIEKEIIRLGKKHKKRFTTYVLGSGLVYGAGEYWFMHFFRQAWSGQDPLPVYFDGQNVLPTIHVTDLANVIQNIVDNPPRQRYIVAKDESFNTLEEIVKAVSTELASGSLLHLSTAELVQAENVPKLTLDQLTMNLRIESATIKEEMQVRWVSEQGMVENIAMLKKEFIEKHKLHPLRLYVYGPPVVGKTPLAKEICKLYQLHHIHLKAVIYETYRNLMEPIKALEQIQETRRAEQIAAEEAEAARQAESELAAAVAEGDESGVQRGEHGVVDVHQEPVPDESIPQEVGEKLTGSATYFTTDYEEYKFTSTTDEVPSIRRSTFTESILDLEMYPIDEAPLWNSEQELEAMAADAKEELENLRDNTDENGRLNDETLVRLVKAKLLSHPCQNQGFVLDGFPKTFAQAELLFQDEEEKDDRAHPYNPLVTPEHVFMLEASNEFVLHRMRQLSTASGLDPKQAKVIPPPWPISFLLRKSTTLLQSDSNLQPTESSLRENEGESIMDEEDKVKEKIEEMETYQDRFTRRLELYRSMLAPAAASERKRLIAEAEVLAMKDAEAEEEHVRHARKQALINEKLSGAADNSQTEDDAKQHASNDRFESMEETEEERLQDVLQEAYEKSLSARLRLIPPLPEQPSDLEENVLSYFDLREIHPVVINMDADLSKVTDSGGAREHCMELIRHRIGRQTALTVPFCAAMPAKLADLELVNQNAQRAEKARMKRELSARNREEREAAECRRLLEKNQNDWNDWLQLIRAENHECAEAQALPMRHYLMRYVMPELTKALLACAELRPEDPIDYLAEYLLNDGL